MRTTTGGGGGGGGPDTDSGIDRGQAGGTDSRISQVSAPSLSSANNTRGENPKLWASFKKHVRRYLPQSYFLPVIIVVF